MYVPRFSLALIWEVADEQVEFESPQALCSLKVLGLERCTSPPIGIPLVASLSLVRFDVLGQ